MKNVLTWCLHRSSWRWIRTAWTAHSQRTGPFGIHVQVTVSGAFLAPNLFTELLDRPMGSSISGWFSLEERVIPTEINEERLVFGAIGFLAVDRSKTFEDTSDSRDDELTCDTESVGVAGVELDGYGEDLAEWESNALRKASAEIETFGSVKSKTVSPLQFSDGKGWQRWLGCETSADDGWFGLRCLHIKSGT